MIARRSFLFRFSTALLTAPTALPILATATPPRRLYIGTGGRGPGNGICTADWNPTTGEIGGLSLAAEVASPTFLAQFRYPDGQTSIYAVSEVDDTEAGVSAFTTVPGQRTLKLSARPRPAAAAPRTSPSPRWMHRPGRELRRRQRQLLPRPRRPIPLPGRLPRPVLRHRFLQGPAGRTPHPLRRHLARRPLCSRQRPWSRPHHGLPPELRHCRPDPRRHPLLVRPTWQRSAPPRLEPRWPRRLLHQ